MTGRNSAPDPERLESRAKQLEKLADQERDKGDAQKLLGLAGELREYAAQIRGHSPCGPPWRIYGERRDIARVPTKSVDVLD
jgi:hypothetical protein